MNEKFNLIFIIVCRSEIKINMEHCVLRHNEYE